MILLFVAKQIFKHLPCMLIIYDYRLLNKIRNFCLLYAAAGAAAKSLQSCPTLCGPIDGSP